MALKPLFTDIADAIRDKDGTSAPINAVDFPQRILDIPTGAPTPPPITSKMPIITWLYRDMVTGEDKVTHTNVPIGGTAVPPSDVGNIPANDGSKGSNRDFRCPALTFLGWNYTSTEMQNVQADMCIGAEYVTADGWSYFYVDINLISGLGPHPVNFRSTAGNTITIDWMDGTPNHTFTGTGTAVNKTWGSYGIKSFRAKVTTGTGDLIIGSTATATSMYGGANVSSANSALFLAFLGENVSFNTNTFQYSSLKSISMGRAKNIVDYQFRYTNPLGVLIIPRGTNSSSIAYGFMNECNALHVSLPKTIQNIPKFGIACLKLKTLCLHENVTSIDADFVNQHYSLVEIICTTNIPPTFVSLGALRSRTKIYVPDESVDDYKNATNWVAVANRIYPISELYT